MLDLVAEALRGENLHFTRIDGSMTDTSRRESLGNFRANEGCNILLATIGSAGVG